MLSMSANSKPAFVPPVSLPAVQGKNCALHPRRPRAPPLPLQARRQSLRCTANALPSSSKSDLLIPRSSFWQWGNFGQVHYRHAGTSGPVILFVPGFGVGAFHFEQNLSSLSEQGFRVYAVDKLGLGRSQVASGEVAASVSTRLWRDQIIAFIEEVLNGEPVFLAGNSLGGLLSASVASERTDLVRGAVLLNAAPFWTALPASAPYLVRATAAALLSTFWRRLTDEEVVRRTLRLVYARKDAVTDALVAHILAPTRSEWAQDAFQAALLAPPLAPGFEATVEDAFGQKQVPLAAINGRSDPWVGPVWGARLKKLAPLCSLYELEPCGHCAHDEAPGTVEFLVSEWVRAVVDERPVPTFGSADAPAGIGDVEVVTRSGPLSVYERLAGTGNMGLTFVLAAFEALF